MIRSFLPRIVAWVLANPLILVLQQRLNTYHDSKRGFADYLDVSGKKVPDLGRSAGNCAFTILDKKANAYTGFDRYLSYAGRAEPCYPDGRFLTMDWRKPEFPGDSFDLVAIRCLLHHMPGEVVASCTAEVDRVRKPDVRSRIIEPLFTPWRWVSNFLPAVSSRRFIGSFEGDRIFLKMFGVERERFFFFGQHHLTSFVLTRPEVT